MSQKKDQREEGNKQMAFKLAEFINNEINREVDDRVCTILDVQDFSMEIDTAVHIYMDNLCLSTRDFGFELELDGYDNTVTVSSIEITDSSFMDGLAYHLAELIADKLR